MFCSFPCPRWLREVTSPPKIAPSVSDSRAMGAWGAPSAIAIVTTHASSPVVRLPRPLHRLVISCATDYSDEIVSSLIFYLEPHSTAVKSQRRPTWSSASWRSTTREPPEYRLRRRRRPLVILLSNPDPAPEASLPCLCKRDHELDSKMARTLLEVIGLGDLEHGADDIRKLAAEKARFSASELDEELEGLLGGGLLARVEEFSEGALHGGEDVAEVVAASGRGEALDEVDGGAEGGDSNIGGRGVGEGGEEDGVEGGEERT